MNFAAVGGFVLLLGAAFVAGGLWLASGGAFGVQYDNYLALVNESVSGLNVNAPVKYRGVDVGKVQYIRLDKANPEQVRLTFAIEHGTPIKTDTEAVLKTQGLTGIAYVELSGGTRDAPPLVATVKGEYPIIRTKPSLIARLETMLTSVLEKLDSTSSSISAILSEENQRAFKSALADFATVTAAIAARKDSLDAGIASATRTFENSARVTAELGPVIARIGRGADAVESMGKEAALASSRAGRTVDEVGADVKRLTTETIPEVQRLVGEMTDLTASLRRLSEKVEGSPGGLLLGKRAVPAGPGETAAVAR